MQWYWWVLIIVVILAIAIIIVRNKNKNKSSGNITYQGITYTPEQQNYLWNLTNDISNSLPF